MDLFHLAIALFGGALGGWLHHALIIKPNQFGKATPVVQEVAKDVEQVADEALAQAEQPKQ